MNQTTEVIKSGRRKPEKFDNKKLEKSIVATCLSVHSPIGQAEATAKSVSKQIEEWLNDRPEITSKDIRSSTADLLSIHQPEAAYLYKQRNITI